MSVFFAILITVVAFAFVAYPVLRVRPRAVSVASGDASRELYSKRDTTYAALKELEFDYQSGVLTEEDYHELEARYKKKGVSILKDIDSLEKGPGADDAIEREVQQIRAAAGPPEPENEASKPRRQRHARLDEDVEAEIARLRSSPQERVEDDIERQVRRIRQTRTRFCTKCGARSQPGDSYCGVCGAKLRQGGSR